MTLFYIILGLCFWVFVYTPAVLIFCLTRKTNPVEPWWAKLLIVPVLPLAFGFGLLSRLLDR